ncbi:DUF4868 domain-containing protein [Vibrio parahaemolyticus]|nr:DUF4868 domain-containing protein [Vibrio parahaemolyticus]EJG2025249.1 DUF4868 domain-containing protein [Vibrio parahaemolyticus]EJG2034790.1 DUF4868 domain-containing protein [Vibrio parahaemolyticus]
MTTTDFQSLKSFDFGNSTPHLWVFKDSSSAARFRTFYVQTEDGLNTQLKGFIATEIGRITEHNRYTYISQTNENSCLSIDPTSTDFPQLKALVDRLESEHRITDAKDLKGAKGYVVKFTSNGTTVYAVKRSTSTWKTSYPKKYINMIFSNGELSGVEDNSFSIEKNFDFYVINNTVFIANKRGFESAMQHRTAYVQAFAQLQQTPAFSGLFSDINPIIEYVGKNSIQLRRMAVIEEKGIYNRPNFISTLQRVNTTRNWGINFHPTNNTIIPCESTVSTIINVLLDHRLMSEITDNIYDVPDATQV